MKTESEPDSVEAVPVAPASPRQVLLGLFILFQLAFLILSNMVGMVQWVATDSGLKDKPKMFVDQLAPKFTSKEGHLWTWCDRVETGTRRWTQLTGQDQDWSLFSPGTSKATGVPILLMSWDHPTISGPSIKGSKLDYDAKLGFNLVTAWGKQIPDDFAWLPSENAPEDDKNYVKFGKARIRRVEGQFYMNALPYDDDKRTDVEARLTRRMQELLRDNHDGVLRYMQWRVRSWLRAHPGETEPRQVMLMEQFYRIHDPGEPLGWDGPMLLPQVLWMPKAEPLAGKYLLEPFNYSTQRFEPMAK
ncbi:MAG TPA: hypothetical protein VFE62_26770 [Gemmataceae bacterium]|nr:hypothetical protein [Gemmataceae bacterium]